MSKPNYIHIEAGKLSEVELFNLSEKSLHNCEDEWQEMSWQFIADWLNNDKSTIEVKTSGSTGEPKLISHKKSRMLNSAAMTCAFFNLKESDTAFCCMPLTGIGGIMMVVRAFYQKMNLVIVKPESNPLKNIDFSIDLMSVVPFQLAKILEENPGKLQQVKNLIVGGGAMQDAHEKKLIELGVNVWHSFGMTETLSHIALRKVGEPYFNILSDVSIDTDEHGRLRIEAPGILEKPLLTNDLVKIISDKEFEWLGRFDNAIETGGIKVIPELLEKKIFDLIPHRFFIDSIPHDTLNNEIVLVVESEKFTIEIETLKERLSKYEIPRKMFCVPKFLETESGKIKRKETLALALN